MARRQFTGELIDIATILRGQGKSYREIGRAVGMHHTSVQRFINPNFGKVRNTPVAANDNVVVRAVPFNGGHSTAENPYMYVAMPRLSFIDGLAA